MKIKKYSKFKESIDELRDIKSPTFDFTQTIPIVHRSDISNNWKCNKCGNEWENFNKKDPIECINCGSDQISEIQLMSKDGEFINIYNLKNTYENLDPEQHQEIIEEIKSMIQSTIEKSGGEFNTFVDSMIKDPEKFKIEGLINESDIYDFYQIGRASCRERVSSPV